MPMTNAEKQAAHRVRKAAKLADLQQQITRLQGSSGTKADQITAALEMLSALTGRLITASDNDSTDEQAASYAAAAEITRARHHAAAALQILHDLDSEDEAQKAS